MSLTIEDGGLIVKDPADQTVLTFNWDDHLAAGVGISTSLFTVTAVRPSTDTALTTDSASFSSVARTTQARVLGGTVGALYELANKVVTNETPAQTKERSVRILVQNR